MKPKINTLARSYAQLRTWYLNEQRFFRCSQESTYIET
jgi:hypothetical protein